jgi:dephospho-CoA kinase
MIKVALTGNIGSGKSTVIRIFESLGIPVFHADKEAKLLYKRQDVKDAVRSAFGDAAFNNSGEVDFKKLAGIVFKDKEALKKINEIIHPLVNQQYNKWLEEYQEIPYTLHEAAIVFENNLEHHYDVIINVSAPTHIRMERVLKRDGITTEQFYERANKQWSEEEKNKRSDFVIINDGKRFLIPQVLEIHESLLKTAKEKG